MKRALIRSSLFNIFFYAITLFACIALLPALALPRKQFLGIVQLWLYAVMFLERNVLGLYYEVRGAENLPKDGAFIVAAKHQSPYETFKLRLLLDDPAIILKRELLRIPLWGWYLKKSDVIAIDRSNARTALSSMKNGALHMKEEGRPIIIFPQGTRVKPDETTEYKPYKTGIQRIQAATDLPIIPLALNSGMFWPRKGWFKSPGTVVFEFLKPVKPGKDNKTLNFYLEDKLETASLSLMNEARETPVVPSSTGFKILTMLTAIIALLFASYSVYWFKSAERITARYVEFITDLSPTVEPPAAPELTGYPWKMRIHVPKQNIAFTDGRLEITDFTMTGWPFPATTSHLQTGALVVHYHDWEKPLLFNSLRADLRYSKDVLHIKQSSLRKEELDMQVQGTADFNQTPFPRLDLLATVLGHKVLLRDLARAGVIDVKAALFIGAGLNLLSNEDGDLEVPIHQKDARLYAGSLKLFDIEIE